MKIDKAVSISELVDLVQEELDYTNFNAILLDDLLRKAYSLGYNAGKECDEDIF